MSRTAKMIAAGAAVAALAACADGQGTPAAPSTPSAVPSPTASPTPTPPPSPVPSPTVVSDVSKLVRAGVDLRVGVLIDVADDGVDRFLEVGTGGVVDFTGTSRTDSTMMSLHAAPVAGQNLVVIKPPFWNEEVGPGYCVADTTGAALRLDPCRPGDREQTWRVVLAGDSGQFELEGAHGIIHVENGLITTADRGRTGLQTIRYAQ
ncbi:hypothetical protein F4553_000547 [Allocatelliglobosispora scoriae]|uniref:Ricin B lectin domain-containing protein n=1 Tax=Allocatelliglobosispora scoriae TaxID=643052 RepID=A0A841BIL7_9ACTN|nr:hypothetical protein [Allocatelliglobosispora scoriae]MBB5867168.1 hypothetical protein [Allocatelliglobosispora scoriae]